MTTALENAHRAIVLFGAETRLGQAICSQLKSYPSEVMAVTLEGMGRSPERFVLQTLRDKKPDVVINCLADPDSGFPPVDGGTSLVSSTLAMAQQCVHMGLQYIHVSSSRIFGWPDELRPRRPYHAYDPAFAGDDPWERILLSLEHTVLDQTHLCSPAALKPDSFTASYLILRFGHLLHTYPSHGRPSMLCTLDRAITLAMQPGSQFVVPNPEAEVSILTTRAAAELIIQAAAKPSPRLLSGSYNIGSKAVSLSQLFSAITIQTGIANNLYKTSQVIPPEGYYISGVDTSTAVSSMSWEARTGKPVQAWQNSLSDVARFVAKRR